MKRNILFALAAVVLVIGALLVGRLTAETTWEKYTEEERALATVQVPFGSTLQRQLAAPAVSAIRPDMVRTMIGSMTR